MFNFFKNVTGPIGSNTTQNNNTALNGPKGPESQINNSGVGCTGPIGNNTMISISHVTMGVTGPKGNDKPIINIQLSGHKESNEQCLMM